MEQILNTLINIFTYEFGPPGTQLAVEPVTALIGMGGSLISGLFGGRAARKAAKAAERRAKKLMQQIEVLEASRQQVINPFAGVENLVTNPFASLTVATRAAEMQAQQTDLSLASTLDTLRATGAGAGGATALAQAALSAKQGVAASIQQQEARNQQLRAQGEARRQQFVAQAQARGRQFVFEAQEEREMQKLNRLSSLASAAQQQAAAARGELAESRGQVFGAIGSIAAAGLLTDGFSKEGMERVYGKG